MIIKIFTVTKNEYDLIEKWIIFYGNIFGYENLVVIDNNSTDKKTLKVYEKFSNRINIYKEDNYENGKQGEHFTKYMTIEKQNCDFLLGCDTDNFLILNDTNTIDKCNYISFFENLPKNINKFLIHSSYDICNIDTNGYNYKNFKLDKPIEHTVFYKNASVCINFFRSKNFVETFNGNHFSITNPDQKPYMTNASMVHYNYTGMKRLEEKSIQIVEGYNYMKVLYPLYEYENSLKNFYHLKNFLIKTDQCAGIHRVRQAFLIFLIYLIINLINKFSCSDEKENLFIKIFYNHYSCTDVFTDPNFIVNRLTYTEDYIIDEIKKEKNKDYSKNVLTIGDIYTILDKEKISKKSININLIKNFLKENN